ncbi:hypothetical protein EV207_1652 [Scopulibacillus darangshiensis]|uniref:Chemotaxis methyl-accepting receptor HlyB-like 4HB MCP domain-containing protein n=2 Tax=Scopulibacillus darangshiensis TaxID=442528 RepID=A0A4V2SKE8_9BACL|nr:hypothetical protein EV207_1652 [Scopulibacillus darangshiensis]
MLFFGGIFGVTLLTLSFINFVAEEGHHAIMVQSNSQNPIVQMNDLADRKDVKEYRSSVSKSIDEITSSLANIGDYSRQASNNPKLTHDEEWKKNVTEEWQDAESQARKLKKFDAPKELKSVQKVYNQVGDEVILAKKTYLDGLNQRNMDLITESGQHIQTVFDLLDQAKKWMPVLLGNGHYV